MHIREVIFLSIVNRIRRNNIFIAWRVISKLQPTHTTKQRIKDNLLHFTLGIHLFQCSISHTFQYLSRKVSPRFLNFKKYMRIIKRDAGYDLTGKRIHTGYFNNFILVEVWNVKVKLIRLEKSAPRFVASLHVFSTVLYGSAPVFDLFFFQTICPCHLFSSCLTLLASPLRECLFYCDLA